MPLLADPAGPIRIGLDDADAASSSSFTCQRVCACSPVASRTRDVFTSRRKTETRSGGTGSSIQYGSTTPRPRSMSVAYVRSHPMKESNISG